LIAGTGQDSILYVMRFSIINAAVCGLTAAVLGVTPNVATAQTRPILPVRVAVFSQTDFPRYGVSALLVPKQIADDLRATGVQVDLLDVATLANPARFDAKKYAAVILPYGNMFPQEAFANLRRFHQAGGSLVTTGIPFTHPAARLSLQDWHPTPQWGNSVQLAVGAGPTPNTNAIRLVGNVERWIGISSSRFPVRSGDRVTASASLRETAPPPANVRTSADQKDELFIRFFDANGTYIRQEGVTLTPTGAWQKFQVSGTVPDKATQADLSVQVRRPGRRYLVAGFTASVNDKSVSLPNANLSRRGEEFLDIGHSDSPALWGPDGIGVGGFAGPGSQTNVAPATISPGDPFRLRGVIGETRRPQPAPQWLNPASLPKGVQIIPAIGEPSRPIAALVVHKAGAFKGAVDAWTYRTFAAEREDFEARQVVVRGTVAVLARKGLLNKTQETAAFRRLDTLPRPPVYANLILPKVARRYSTFQPKMPAAARHLYVADIRRRTLDEKILLTSLQGIVNRKQPRIYFLFDDDDRAWLEELQKQKATDAPITVDDPFSLVDKFRGEFKGAVLCDPKIYVSPCVAVSLAGADDLLVAKTPEIAARVKVPVKVDLRGKFKDNADALRYIHTKVMPRLDPYLTCSLDPAVYGSGALDSLIAARASTFWITGPKAQSLPGANQPGEMAEIRAMFAKMPLGAVVRGFWWHGDDIGLSEGDGVALGSRFGKVTLVSDLITNLSVHSGVPAQNLKQKPRPPAPPLDPSKVYISFTMSDGDNLCTWRGYFKRYFEDPARGTFPVGWGMGPAILDLAPAWARWFYENATPNDEFICDVSGVAYIYPPSWATALKDRDGAFRWFYGETQDYMNRMDMKTIRLMDVNAESIAKVGTFLPGVEFLMPDYGHAGPTKYEELTYTLPTGQPSFRAATSGSGPQHLADQIRERAKTTRPAFLNVFIWNWGSNLSDLKKVLEILGPEYVAVTPSQLNALYKEATGKARVTVRQ
jgi:hypothetical protein